LQRDHDERRPGLPPGAQPLPLNDGSHVKEDTSRTRRDIRAAVIFGVIAATIELGLLIYFFR
jgi:hypothetical protein